MRLFITGIGSGLGKALVEEALKRNYEVYALSRHLPEEFEGRIKFQKADLKVLERIPLWVQDLLREVREIDTVILNAGILGELKDMRDVSLHEMEEVMKVNLWANKVIVDTLVELNVKVDMLIGISSGAARNCNRGWNAYSISKAGLNCLLRLYSWELPETHVISLAPGLVLTPMLREVMSADEEKFPSVGRIKRSLKLTPEKAAEFIFGILPKLKIFESGSFIDVREFPEYEEFINKYGVYE
ncbi:SDR family NAD(P)-dependent oxidoreductase [Aquifex pyrophilus]